MTSEQERKVAFANSVLAIMQEDEEWSADTLNEIAQAAHTLNLAETGEDSFFRAKP